MQLKSERAPVRAHQPGMRPIDLVAVIGLVGCCATWGLNQVAMKVANDGITPLFQASLRSAIAACLLALWMRWRGLPMFARDRSLWPGLTTGLLFSLNFTFIGPGLALTEASRGVLFLYTAPFFVAIGAHYLLPGDRLSLLKVAGLTAAFIGLMVSLSDRIGGGGASAASLRGDFYCLSAGFFWAMTTLVIRTTSLKTISPEKNLLYELVVSAPVLFLASRYYGEAGIVALTPLVVWSFAYTTVLVVFISYAVWFWLLNTYPASQVSVFTFLGPIFAVIAGHLLLAEPVTWRLGLALVLVALGIYLVNKPPKRLASGRT